MELSYSCKITVAPGLFLTASSGDLAVDSTFSTFSRQKGLARQRTFSPAEERALLIL